MTFNHKLVDEFLEEIFPLPEKFGVILREDEESEPVDFALIQEIVWNVDPDASVYFGMSKLVITSPHLDGVVIKIPFNGCFNEYDAEGNIFWQPFRWASGTDKSDYCLTEFEKYNRLKDYRLDCFVAKVIYYKEVCGVRVFIQEEVTPDNDSYQTRRPSQRSQDLAEKWYSEGKFYIEPEWIANCLDKYGKSKVKRFLYYCANIDPDILEDIHGGNFGYRSNETPCLLDFSNYSD